MELSIKEIFEGPVGDFIANQMLSNACLILALRSAYRSISKEKINKTQLVSCTAIIVLANVIFSSPELEVSGCPSSSVVRQHLI